MAQGLLLPASSTAETHYGRCQAEPGGTTVLDPPGVRRWVPRLTGRYGDTTNCVIWIGDVLTLKPPLTLRAEPVIAIVQEPNSVADLVAEIIESDLAPSAHVRTCPDVVPPISKAFCIAAAREIAPLIHAARDLRYAAFWNDEDESSSLVIHCSTTKRQITFEFEASGRRTCSKIDEHMQQISVDLNVAGAEGPREFVAWLKRRG